MKAYLKKNIFPLVIGTLVMLFLSEGLLRVIGYETWNKLPEAQMPRVHSFDDLLGWKPIPGTYEIPVYDPASPKFHISIDEKGERITQRTAQGLEKEEVLFIGGSFTFGWAIDDDETFIWKLQEQHPELAFRNLGIGGQGTYQSLLRLEEALKNSKKPLAVVYGFIDHHASRNIAHPAWLETTTRMNGKELAGMPYVSLNSDGSLNRHRVSGLVMFPFKESSVLINMSQRAYNRLLATKRIRQMEETLISTVMRIDELCRKNNIKFFVVGLGKPKETGQNLASFLSGENIPFVDCSVDKGEEYRVPGDGHPNGKANTLFAQCVQEHVFEKYDLKPRE